MKIKLLTREGGFVAAFIVPPFQLLPDIVTWGERFFRAALRPGEDPEYVEAMAWPIIEGATAERAEDDQAEARTDA